MNPAVEFSFVVQALWSDRRAPSTVARDDELPMNSHERRKDASEHLRTRRAARFAKDLLAQTESFNGVTMARTVRRTGRAALRNGLEVPLTHNASEAKSAWLRPGRPAPDHDLTPWCSTNRVLYV
jgi:hypothetical protein